MKAYNGTLVGFLYDIVEIIGYLDTLIPFIMDVDS